MAELTVQNIAISGLNPTYSAASASGDTFTNDGRVFLHVRNGGGSQITVTIDSQVPCDQGFDHDVTIQVPAAGEKMIGPYTRRFNDDTNKVKVNYSAVTSVTVAAIRLPS